MRRWATTLLAALVVLDVLVLLLGLRARNGDLPPLQRGAGATYAADPSAAPTTEAPTDQVAGPLMLGANASGLVLRATRGACESRFENPARFWVGHLNDAAGLRTVEVPTLLEVLGLVVLADGTLRISGLDESCNPATVVSSDEGSTWDTSDAAQVWRLASDTRAGQVTGPAGAVIDLGCVPTQVVNLPGRRATVTCEGLGTFYTLGSGTTPVAVSVPTFNSVAATPAPGEEDTYYVFGGTVECPAQVAILRLDEQQPDLGHCFDENVVPLAVATAGDRVLVQVGAKLMVSDDRGDSFTTVGP